MFDLQSCKITGREERSDASNMFTVNVVSYESTFVDKSKEEYVYTSELIYVNKVPTLVDCLNHTISVFYNKRGFMQKSYRCSRRSVRRLSIVKKKRLECL